MRLLLSCSYRIILTKRFKLDESWSIDHKITELRNAQARPPIPQLLTQSVINYTLIYLVVVRFFKPSSFLESTADDVDEASAFFSEVSVFLAD